VRQASAGFCSIASRLPHLLIGEAAHAIRPVVAVRPGHVERHVDRVHHDLDVASADSWLKENGVHLSAKSTLDPMPVFFSDL